jgi:hypothetical protein
VVIPFRPTFVSPHDWFRRQRNQHVSVLGEEVENVYSVLYAQDHDVLMEMHVATRIIKIADGKIYALGIWAPLVKHILVRTGKLPTQSQRSFVYQKSNLRNATMQLEVDDGDKWSLVRSPPFIKQPDGYNCGPNVILRMMSLFNRIPRGMDIRQLEPDEVRQITMPALRSLIQSLSVVSRVGRYHTDGHLLVCQIPPSLYARCRPRNDWRHEGKKRRIPRQECGWFSPSSSLS